MATTQVSVTFTIPWLVHPTDPTQNLPLRLTPRTITLRHPQTVTETETLGSTRKSRGLGNVLGAEADIIVVADHSDIRTYNATERLKAAKQLSTTWLWKFPTLPRPLMAGVPGRVLEVSLGEMREVVAPDRTVITIPAVEVGEPCE